MRSRSSTGDSEFELSPEEQEALQTALRSPRREQRDANRLPGPGRDLHRGRAARSAARPGRATSRCARRPSTTRSSPSSAATPTARWSRSRTRSRARCGRPSTRSRSTPSGVTIVGEYDHPVRPSLIARQRGPAGSDRGRSSPTRSRSPSAPASSASSCPGPRRGPSAAPPRRSGGGRVGAAVGGARQPLGRRALRLRGPPRGRRGRGDNVTRFVWIAPARDRRRAATAPGGPRWSSPSSARTTRERWSRRCWSSRAATST